MVASSSTLKKVLVWIRNYSITWSLSALNIRHWKQRMVPYIGKGTWRSHREDHVSAESLRGSSNLLAWQGWGGEGPFQEDRRVGAVVRRQVAAGRLAWLKCEWWEGWGGKIGQSTQPEKSKAPWFTHWQCRWRKRDGYEEYYNKNNELHYRCCYYHLNVSRYVNGYFLFRFSLALKKLVYFCLLASGIFAIWKAQTDWSQLPS